jgi:phosphate transport system protein
MTAHFVNLLDELHRRSLRMATGVADMVAESWESVEHTDHALALRVIARDAEVDAEEVAIEAKVIELMTLFQPVASDMRLLCTVLKVNSDLERVADCAVNIAERARHLSPQSDIGKSDDLKRISQTGQRIFRNAIQTYATGDATAAEQLLGEDDAIDAFYGEFIRKMAVEAAHTPEMMTTHLDIFSIAKNLERIADHATNIAEDVVFRCTGKIIRHGLAQ